MKGAPFAKAASAAAKVKASGAWELLFELLEQFRGPAPLV